MDHPHARAREVELETLGQAAAKRGTVDVAADRLHRRPDRLQLGQEGGFDQTPGMEHELGFADQLDAARRQPSPAARHVSIAQQGDM